MSGLAGVLRATRQFSHGRLNTSAATQPAPLRMVVPTRLQMSLWAGLLLVTSVVALQNYGTFQLGTYTDDATYTILAQSLLGTRGYGLIHSPGEPASTQFPFGYPLLLSVALRLGDGDVSALKNLSLVATLANVGLLFWAWPLLARSSHWWGLAIAGLYGLAPLVIDHTRMAMSEAVFTTFCLCALILTELIASSQRKWWLSPALSLALTFTIYTRTVGVALLAAVFAYLVWRAGRAAWGTIAVILIQMAAIVAAIVAATPVMADDLLPLKYLQDKNAVISVSSLLSDAEPLSAADPALYTPDVPVPTKEAEWDRLPWAVRTIRSLGWRIQQQLLTGLRTAAVPVGGGLRERALADQIGLPFLPPLVGLAITTLVIVGFASYLRTVGATAFLLFGLAYAGLLMLWTWDGTRLLYPVLVHIHLGLLASLHWVVQRAAALASRRWSRARGVAGPMLVGLVLALMAASLYKSLQVGDTRNHIGDLPARTTWLKAHSMPADIVMSQAPAIDYLYSGRLSVPYPPSLATLSVLKQYMTQHGVTYVLVAPHLRWQDLSYEPQYDDASQQLLALLQEPEAAQVARLAHASPTGMIQIYAVLP